MDIFPNSFKAIPFGFAAGGVRAGIKEKGLDLGIIVSKVPAVAAGVFTTNAFKAAPVLITQEHIKRGVAQAIVVNSGNANCCTGKAGLYAAKTMAEEVAARFGCEPEEVLVASTGVIGKTLPIDKVAAGISKIEVEEGEEGFKKFAEAILTTDTHIKVCSAVIEEGGSEIRIIGIAKGAGMIAPNLATMLAFFLTDAVVGEGVLESILKDAVEKSFNRIIVDGDMSTNDSVIALANGLAGNAPLRRGIREYEVFKERFTQVAQALAKMIAQDGEGATKLIEVRVVRARRAREADAIARRVATSPLVKAAIYGQDPNWGRIVAAMGAVDVPIEPDKVEIYINGVKLLAQGGQPTGAEPEVNLEGGSVEILVDLGLGDAEGVVWGCDLTPEYVKINAHYTT